MKDWGMVEIRFNSLNEIHIYATQSLDLSWLIKLMPTISVTENNSTAAFGVFRCVVTGLKEMAKTATWAILKQLISDGWEPVSRSDDYYATYLLKKAHSS